MTTLAPKLPWQHAFAGGFSRLGGQALPTDADAIDYLNRVATADGAAVEVGVAQAIDSFVRGCKSDSAGYAGDPTRTNWDALKACCIMAGARTISGALVPLKTPYGAELVDINALPTPTIQDSSTSGSWDAATRTMSNAATGSATYPRFLFSYGFVSTAKQYYVTGRVSGDTAKLANVAIGGAALSYDSATGVFSGTAKPAYGGVFTFYGAGNLGAFSIRIESLSIREDSFTPTAQGGWTSNEYSRGGSTPGLKGNGTTLYLNTNRANNADPADDCHLSVYSTSPPSGSLMMYAGGQVAVTYDMYKLNADAYFRNGGTSVATGGGSTTGFLAQERSDPSFFSRRIGGVTTQTAAPTRVAEAVNMWVFARNLAGGEYYTDARISFYSIGSACDLAALDSRTTHLMNSIRFTLLTGLNPGDYDPATLAYLLAAYTAGGSLA